MPTDHPTTTEEAVKQAVRDSNPGPKVVTEITIMAHRDGGWIVGQAGTPLWDTARHYTDKMDALAAVNHIMGQLR